MAQSKRDRMRHLSALRRMEKAMIAGRQLNDKEAMALREARAILQAHFDSKVTLEYELNYGKFPGNVLDYRDGFQKIAFDNPFALLKFAIEAAHDAQTPRISTADRNAAKKLEEEYAEFGVKIWVGEFSGVAPTGKTRKPFRVKFEKNKKIDKSLESLDALKKYLKSYCVELANKDIVSRLNTIFKVYFDNKVTCFSSYHIPATYTILDKRKNVGRTPSRTFYSSEELERAAMKLCNAANKVYDELIYQEEYRVMKALGFAFDVVSFTTSGRYKGITASGVERRPFTVTYLKPDGSKITRKFSTVDALKEFSEKNLPHLATRESVKEILDVNIF